MRTQAAVGFTVTPNVPTEMRTDITDMLHLAERGDCVPTSGKKETEAA